LWTRFGSNGKLKVEKRKAKKMPMMKKRLLCRKLTIKSREKEKVVRKERTTKARRKRLAHATPVD
jgi:hypothetical protein